MSAARIPASIVVYQHYNSSVYFDGKLVENYGGGHSPVHGWYALCRLLGIPFELRRVAWEDMPGERKDAVYHPPELLATLEEHFAALDAERKRGRIKQLRAELAKLTGEAS